MSKPGNAVTTQDVGLSANMGRMPGYRTEDKFGHALLPATVGEKDIWEAGTEYIFDDEGTAPIMYMSCSDALDSGQTISITGLDIDGKLTVQNAISDGQNLVILDTPLYRCYRMQNITLNTKVGQQDLAGMIYVHIDPAPTAGVPLVENLRCEIDDGNNQSLMAIYTTPLGFVSFLYRGEIGIGLEGAGATISEFSEMYYKSRRLGHLFAIKKRVALSINGSSIFQDARSFPDIIPALTDIKIGSSEVSSAMHVWATLDILEIPESEFTPEYLAAIGQPSSMVDIKELT
jgi:hypothetical protein